MLCKKSLAVEEFSFFAQISESKKIVPTASPMGTIFYLSFNKADG